MSVMKISEILKQGKPTISFEVYPPKTDDLFPKHREATMKIAAMKPDFMSVTYGANGGTRRHTFQMASDIQTEHGVTALAHITCVTTDRAGIHERLDDLKSKNIENVLALRGDIPEGYEFPQKGGYLHANELAADIKAYGDFCVGAACYPEGHPDCNGRSTLFDGVPWNENGVRDMCVFEAPGACGVYVAELDLDSLRIHRRNDVMGDKYRRPEKYAPLTI